jgi:hypothetical protein
MNLRKATFLSFFLIAFLFLAGRTMQAQAAPSAFHSPLSLTVGGTASIFEVDYVPAKIGGVGAYVDLNIFHGVGLEAEGRWQRFHEPYGISQDNYLVGPRVQVLHLWKAHPYVKVLGGFTNMNFGSGIGTGRFTTVAFGGGVDLRLTRKISVRAIDAEYQWWPDFLGTRLNPYGLSAGVSYRIF